jgi:hypothetical protein
MPPESSLYNGQNVVATDMYLSLLPTLLVVVASFGALFCLIGWAAHRYAAHTGVWLAWILYVPAVSAGCILKLTGIRWGAPIQPGLLLYYIGVAFAGLGLPLLASTLVFVTESRRSMSPRRSSVFAAWIAAIATTPLAIAAIAVVDLFQPGR